VRVTVIAAGFDGGTPTRKHDDRALGQVSPPVRQNVPSGGQRPYGGQSYGPPAPAEPAPVAQQPAPVQGQPVQAPAPSPVHGQPYRQPQPVGQDGHAQNGQAGREAPIVVPDTLEPVRVGRGPGSVSFDDVEDDLDVPDFLK
jgi:cell division protein FtsZ